MRIIKRHFILGHDRPGYAAAAWVLLRSLLQPADAIVDVSDGL